MRRLLTPARLAAVALVAATGLAFLYVFPSDDYLYLPDRARPLAPLVRIEDERPPSDAGGIYYVSVSVRRATLLESLLPGIYDGSEKVSKDEVREPGESDEEHRRAVLGEMRRSQRVAAAVALRELGRDVRIRATGVVVTAVVADAPAGPKLRAGDVILAVDGKPTRMVSRLRSAIRRHPPGTRVRLRIRRDRSTRDFALRTIADPRRPGESIIGIGVSQAAQIRLPIDVDINLGDVGGPSAGLAFALDIFEELGRDVDHGRRIAATGEIFLDGTIGPVGGLRQKTIGARRAGVDLFLVPAGENTAEARRYAEGLRVEPVKSFRQALQLLATLPAKTSR
ncbi:MAG: PDZ domain-containing protein [Gaiellaceae bacterium]